MQNEKLLNRGGDSPKDIPYIPNDLTGRIIIQKEEETVTYEFDKGNLLSVGLKVEDKVNET